MIGFKTELVTKRDMSKDFCWILDENLVYENEAYVITVCAGFDFDFASIPWFFRRVLPKNGRNYDRASCLHDALYASRVFTKDLCDAIFYEAMIADNVNDVLASIMFSAVSIAGNSAYYESEHISKYRNLVKVEVKNG